MTDFLAIEDYGALEGPDLLFPNDPLAVQFPMESGRIADIDGRVYNLSVPELSPNLTALMAQALSGQFSKHPNEIVRKRSNVATLYLFRGFLKFAAKLPLERQILSRELLFNYKTQMFRQFEGVTAYGRYNCIRRAAKYLIQRKLVPAFPVPKNESKRRVTAGPRPRSGATFATVFGPETNLETTEARTTNESLLKDLCNLLWDNIDRCEETLRQEHSAAVTNAFMVCSVGLLAAACVNPSSIPLLRGEDLHSDDKDMALRRLVFPKPRSRSDVALPPFPIGGAKARTIPRLWERIRAITDVMREEAPEQHKEKLILRYNRYNQVTWYDDSGLASSLISLRKLISGKFWEERFEARSESTECTQSLAQYPYLRMNSHHISYALIRTTAINVANARLKRNLADTQLGVGHKLGSPATDDYLNNISYKQDLDQELRTGQQFVENWARKPVRVLPPDPSVIAAEVGSDPETAERAIDDEMNLGMGASLVNGQTIVIDTPLNALRMIQWIEKLKNAEKRMVADNPERWRGVYEPQLILFQQALLDFSYLSREEARRLSVDIELPFPEVI